MGIMSRHGQAGHPSAKFKNVGDCCEGTILAVREQQATDYTTDKPLYWNAGGRSTTPSDRPVMNPVLTVQTELRDDQDDDGIRDVYFEGGRYTALRNAMREQDLLDAEDEEYIGRQILVKLERTEPASNRKHNDRKIFSVWFGQKPGEEG